MKDVIIKKTDFGFEVFQGEKSSGDLSFDEVLGLVSVLLIKSYVDSKVPCERWMKTPEERKKELEFISNLNKK